MDTCSARRITTSFNARSSFSVVPSAPSALKGPRRGALGEFS